MKRTLLIGLDGATFSILDALMEQGHMPFLQSFMHRGCHAQLQSTVHPLTPPAWTSMITGRTPGNHGIFDFIYCRQTPQSIFFNLNMSYDIRCPTLWSIVSRQGMRVAALNFPVSYPPEPVNGVHVAGHVNWRHLKLAVYPPAFYEKVQCLPGFDPKLLSMDAEKEFQSIQFLPAEEYEGWILHHIAREQRWLDILRIIFKEDPPMLSAVVFDGVDKLQHLCWRLLDPATRPSNPTSWESRIVDRCLAYFRQLDAIMAELVELAGNDARTFIASDHGFGPTSIVFFANTWLARKGYLFWKPERESATSNVTNIADRPLKFHVENIDWDKTIAFALNPSGNGIYIRRADSSGSFGVSPEHYEEFRRSLAADLLSLTHPDTGQPFFDRVLTREEAFPGDSAGRAPDLTVLMKDHGFLSVLDSDEILRRRSEPWGTHYPQGVFLAAGPGISRSGRLPALNIIDIAPTLLRSLGLKPLLEMEGRSPDDLFEGTDEHAAGEPESEGEVREEVLKRLRAIGYIAQ